MFKKHYLIVLIALILGLASSLPQYFAAQQVPGFAGIYHQVADDGIYYQARAKDVLDGHPLLTNPYLLEHKNDFPMQFWLPDAILAAPIGLFGLSVPLGFIIWNFFLTALVLLLTYAILFVLTSSRRWSVVGAVLFNICIFGGYFLRLPSPGLNFVFWLVLLLSLLLFIRNKSLKWGIATALSFGLLFHIYPYYWTFYVVAFAVFLFLSFLILRNETPYKKYLGIFAGAGIIGLPYFVSLYQSSKLLWNDETLARVGMIQTHFPSGISSVIVGGIVVLLFVIAYRKKNIQINETSLLLFSGVLATMIVINQHIITGKNLEFSSHYYMANMFWCGFALLYLFVVWFERQTSALLKKRLFIAIACVVGLTAICSLQKTIVREITYSQGDVRVQEYAPVLAWLDRNAPKESVVFSNVDFSYYIPVYTSHNVVYSPFSILFFMSDQEARERFIVNHYFETFTPAFVLDKHRQIFGSYYIDEYGHNQSKNKLRKLFGLKTENYELVPKEKIELVVAEAEALQKVPFKDLLKKYQVSYLVWDKTANPDWKIEKMPFLKPVYTREHFVVYTVSLD